MGGLLLLLLHHQMTAAAAGGRVDGRRTLGAARRGAVVHQGDSKSVVVAPITALLRVQDILWVVHGDEAGVGEWMKVGNSSVVGRVV